MVHVNESRRSWLLGSHFIKRLLSSLKIQHRYGVGYTIGQEDEFAIDDEITPLMLHRGTFSRLSEGLFSLFLARFDIQ